MFVGGGVINRGDLPGFHDVQQFGVVAHGTQNRQHLDLQRLPGDPLLQLGKDGVKVELAMVQQQQRGGLEQDDLSTQLRADRTAGASHQHTLVLDTVLHQLFLRRDRVAAQQVGDVHFLQIVYFYPPCSQIGKIRHAAHVKRKALQKPEDFPATGSGRGRNRQKNFLSARYIDHLLDVLGFVDLQTGNHSVGDRIIVVDKGDRSHRTSHSQCRYQLVAGSARAINRNLGKAVVPGSKRHMTCGGKPVAEEILAHRQAQPADHHQAQPPVIKHYRTRYDVLMIAVEVYNDAQNKRGKAHCLDDRHQCVVAEITHHRAIHTDPDKQGNGNDGGADEQPGVGFDRIDEVVDAKADQEGHPQREPDQTNVCTDLNYSLLPTRQRQQHSAQLFHASL